MSYTRRGFLKASLGASTLLSLSPTLPTFLSCSAYGAAPRRDVSETVLVVVQLTGGNDGLNTVVPYDDDEYARNRPTLRLAPNEVHRIDSQLGFHPEMQAFMNLYQEGRLIVIQGVGYPNSPGDHFEAMLNWHTARPGQIHCQTGWLGRAADHACREGEVSVPAVFVGNIAQPFGLNAERAIVPSVGSVEEYTLRTMPGSETAHRRQLLETAGLPRADIDNPFVDLLRRSTLDAYASSERIEAAGHSVAPAAEYPPFQLAGRFRTIAHLIRADLGIRIYYTELGGGGFGGFDNHANQRDNHAALLRQLSKSIAALMGDLDRDRLLDRVLLMTFSEFGRTVKENGRRGTDHGAAAPMFLAGGRLKGGLVGPHPSLTDLDGGGQRFHTDFRRVYATVLDRWLAFDSPAILGEKFEPLDVLEA
jgi:uncharacterized protein (DUF1501 family)